MKYDRARRLLIDELRIRKDNIINMIESGDRDFEVLRKLLSDYIEYQSAADVLEEIEVRNDSQERKKE